MKSIANGPEHTVDLETTDATPEVVKLGEVPKPGTYVMLPTLAIMGANVDGSEGNYLQGSYALLNVGGTPELRPLFSGPVSWGSGPYGIAVALSGTTLEVTLTGVTSTTVRWTLRWTCIERQAT